MFVCSSRTRIILIGILGRHSKWLERRRIGLPCGRNWWKTWILMNQLHFLITYTWDVLNVHANRMKWLSRIFQRCLNHRFLPEQLKSYQGANKPYAITVAWSNDMEGHARKCLERYCELANKEVEQFFNVSSPCLDDHQFKQEEVESVGEFGQVCSQIVFKKLVLGTNRETRHSMVCQQICKVCDRRLARLISYFLHTNEFRQYCNVGNTAQHCRLGLFQDSDFAGDLEDSKSTSTRVLCIFGSQTFVTISWMCKKQTLVSHSSTESDVISLDAGLRMDGIFALDLWDMVIEVLRSTINTARRTFFSRRVSVVHFWRQRICHQDDYQRTPNTRLQTSWQKEVSRVTSGTIFFVCST